MRKDRNKQQTFVEGAMVLVITIAVVKVLGAIFKIPLGNLIGELGMGYFQTAYDLYLPIYSIALAGMPMAVCRMVAESVTKKHYNDARQVLRVARRVFLVIGLVATTVLIIISYLYLAFILKQKAVLPGMLVIAPSILFCCMISSYRGYYEGLSNMNTTAVSEIIEAIGKLVLGLGLAVIARSIGMSGEYQAAAAIMGITFGEFSAFVYVSLRYKFGGDGITKEQLVNSPAPKSGRDTMKMLITIAIPVVIGSLAAQIAGIIDVVTVQSRLRDASAANGDYFKNIYPDMWQSLLNDPEINGNYTEALAKIPMFLYGCYKGFAFSIYNLIPTITSMLGVSALPTMTMAWTTKNKIQVKRSFELIIRVTSLIALPAGFGIASLSGGILSLLYPGKPIGAAIATPVLSILGIAVIFAGISMPMTNMLQAIGKERIPVLNLVVGAILKIITNYILVGIPSINVKGAAIGTLICYSYICIMDFYYLCKYTKVIPNLMSSIIKPLISASMCGIAAYVSNGLLLNVLSSKVSTVFAIIVACIIYVMALILLKAFTRDDVIMFTKSKKIADILEKLHWI